MRRRLRDEARLRDEMELHLELATEENIRRGMSPDEARRAARLAFGPAEHFKDEARDQFRSPILAAIAADIRYTVRTARRAPMMTTIAVLTLGMAIALATGAFTAVNSALFRALPYSHPNRLALVWGTTGGSASERQPVSFTNAMDWRRDVRPFVSLAAFSCEPRPILTLHGAPARASLMDVSLDFFRVLDTKPMLGRVFDSTDFSSPADVAPDAIILTYPIWRDRFGSNPAVVRSRVFLNGAPVTIIGVLRPDFAPLPASLACRPELYRPLASRYDDAQRTWSFLKIVARIAPDASIEQAQAALDVENARLAAAHPQSNRGAGARVALLGDALTTELRPLLTYAQLGTLLVLLVACTNVGSLLVARAATRRRELSIRMAMGASRMRIARQVATECLLLGAASGLLGLLLVEIGKGVLNAGVGDAFPDPRGLAVDWRVVVVAVVLTLAATVVFGFATAARSLGDASWLTASLRDGGRTSSATRSRFGRLVVASQLAIALVVLLGAGLLARSYRKLRDVNAGFDPTRVMTAQISLPDATYPRGARQVAFFRNVIARISAQSSVVAAGAVSILPESPNFDRTNARVVGKTYAANEAPTPDVYRVTPGYFAAMRIPLREGRLFAETDDDRHPLVAVIGETMAKALFPGTSAIGRRIWTGAGNAERTVVGVVGDVYQYGLDSAKTMQLYVPHADNSGGDLTLVVRSAGSLSPMPALLRNAVHAVDPGVPVDEIASMNQVLDASGARRRLLARLSLIFAIAAVGLASLGLYGVIAYSVSQRTREIGVRKALGATTRSVVLHVLGETSSFVVAGIGIGFVAAAALGRVIAPLLFGVTAVDGVTFLLAPLALVGVALGASVWPSVQAGRVDPAIAMRDE